MKTTVSLTDQVRDRLAALAARHGRTMGEQIEAMVERAEHDLFWSDVAAGYDHGLRVVVHDDYPEYAHLRRPEVPAEGEHNDPPPVARPRRRRASA